MAVPRWLLRTLYGVAALLLVFVTLVGAGLWYLWSVMTPDVTVGEPVADVLLTGLDGVPVELERLRGRVVVLDFWSSW